MMKHVLVVDDEEDIVNLLAYNLEKEGYRVSKAYDGRQALETVKKEKPDLVILDLMLPEISGIDVARAIRSDADTAGLPVIMLTAKGTELDRVLGLEMGADDYVTKPFSVRELTARIRAVLRRGSSPAPEPETFSQGKLFINFSSHEVTVDGKPVELSPTEFNLLKFFTRRPGRVYTRDQILDRVWGDDFFVEPRTVDVHIRRLRSRIEDDAADPRYILTVRGAGYKFSDT
jgi:two-component system, OmpR family, alkaline phosphatase synthesis response regulator PhoP